MQTILLTGGTGTFGHAFVEEMLGEDSTIRIYSRDEYKQSQMTHRFYALSPAYGEQLRFLIGDVRDRERLLRAAEGVDVIIHAAALKQVVSCEYNPDETVKTNVLGTMNVIDAALANDVPRSILLSSDKAVHPVNVYGATKLCAEKLWLAANNVHGPRPCRFSCVRYGNVMGSRGSVVEHWASGAGSVELADERATRFWLEPSEAVSLVLRALETMRGGEVYVPKAKSWKVGSMLPENARVTITGLRPGEKLHETLIADTEIAQTWDMNDYYCISDLPPFETAGGVYRRVPGDFSYASSDPS